MYNTQLNTTLTVAPEIKKEKKHKMMMMMMMIVDL